MRKVFLSLLALVAIPAALTAAPITVTYNVGDTATAYSWANLSVHPTLIVDDVITISATHDVTLESPTNGTYSNSQWYAYKADNNGEFTISADNGYGIVSVGLLNNAQNGGAVIIKNSTDTMPIDGTHFQVMRQSVTFNVVKTMETTKLVTARIKKFHVIYDVLPQAVSAKDMTVKVGDAFQLTASITPETSLSKVTWSSDNSDVVAVDANGMINAIAKGKATLTAKTINGKEGSCEITVVEREDISFTEDYANLGEQAEWKTSYTQYEGSYGQLFRVRNYRHNNETMLAAKTPGVELQNGNNFIAYANAQQEGGAKAVSFQWRAVDPTKPVIFDVDSTRNNAVMNLVSLPANGGYDQVQNFAKDLNFEQNMQLRIRIADAASSNIVFGPITITPYLLYFVKEDTVDLPLASFDCGSEKVLMNNVDSEVVFEKILDSGDQASVNAAGVIDLSQAEVEGDIHVQASWKDVKTVFKLHVKPGTGTALDNSPITNHQSKMIRNGQVVIYRNGSYLNLLGQPVQP